MIHEILLVGPLRCNCSILGDETSREAIVVDPGDDISRILATLQRHSLTVKQIVITHAHIDHIAGAHRLKQLTGAPILYNQLDLPLVKMMDVQASWLGISTPEVPAPDDTLDDGKIISITGLTGNHPPHPRPHPGQRLPLPSRSRPSSSPATPSSPAPSAAPTSPEATPANSSPPSTTAFSPSPTTPPSSPGTAPAPPLVQSENQIHFLT